jgi:hypothetical protein
MTKRKTSTRVLELRGSFKKNPNRKREGEPEVTSSLSAPPDDFTPAEAAAWHMIASKAPMGVLTDADWPSVVMAAKLWAEFMADSENFNTARVTRLHRMLGDFGLNPSDRAGMSIPKPKEENVFAALDRDYPNNR